MRERTSIVVSKIGDRYHTVHISTSPSNPVAHFLRAHGLLIALDRSRPVLFDVRTARSADDVCCEQTLGEQTLGLGTGSASRWSAN